LEVSNFRDFSKGPPTVGTPSNESLPKPFPYFNKFRIGSEIREACMADGFHVLGGLNGISP